jgi:hypothetical protein
VHSVECHDVCGPSLLSERLDQGCEICGHSASVTEKGNDGKIKCNGKTSRKKSSWTF